MTTTMSHEKKIVIDVKNVTKTFRLYFDKGSMLKEQFANPRRSRFELHEVLQDISFQVFEGETLALIGQNGCGKSTVLKMLTKIYYPNSGSIKVNGRVSSLIELGAGFHPDMSGRENIYINASILGITGKEVDKRVDEIIRFSELEEYIDNPIRTYSSGMYMRLAFSVAINVDPDILLIDEILAVGDQAFQEKCIKKLNQLRQKGVTVVLVSHSLGQVKEIADRCIWIDNGKICEDGPTESVCNHYEATMEARRISRDKMEEEERKGNIANDSYKNKKNESEKSAFLKESTEIKWNQVVVVGIILMLLCHSSQDIYRIGYNDMNPDTITNSIFGLVSFILGRMGAPIIFIFLGFKYLSSKIDGLNDIFSFYKKNILPLFISWEIWIIVYLLFLQFFENRTLDFKTWLSCALLQKYPEISHCWMMPEILFFGMLSPFLTIILRRFRNSIYFLTIIGWVLIFLFPSLSYYGVVNGGEYIAVIPTGLSSRLLYMLIGYYMNARSKKIIPLKKEFILFCITLSLTVVSQLYLYINGISYLLWNDYYLISISAILIVDICGHVRFEERIMRVVELFASGIWLSYFIHRLVQLLICRILNQFKMHNSLKMLILWMVTLLFCLLVSSINYGIKQKNKKNVQKL